MASPKRLRARTRLANERGRDKKCIINFKKIGRYCKIKSGSDLCKGGDQNEAELSQPQSGKLDRLEARMSSKLSRRLELPGLLARKGAP